MLVITQPKPTAKGVIELLKKEVASAARLRGVKVMPNGKLKCNSLAWLAKEHKALFAELPAKQQAKVLNALGGKTLKEALEQTAIRYVEATLAKQRKIMHPAKYNLLLLLYAYGNKRRFEPCRFYKQAGNSYKLHVYLQEHTANKICNAYNKQSNKHGYKAIARKCKSNPSFSEYYHIKLLPL